jgi:CRISPR-associated protein Cmr5
MNADKRTTPDQERAAHAWQVVQDARNNEKEEKKREFGTQAKKLPTRILTSGLGPALAFLEAKDYAPRLRHALADWLQHRRPLPGQPTAEQKRLVVRIIHGDADFLRFATAECLAYLQWLVRFTEAEGLGGQTE